MLPLAEDPASSEPPRGAFFANPALKGAGSILLVDDELPLARSGQMALQILGYRVSTHTNAVYALSEFSSNPGSFELVITDQMLPKLTGIDLARKLIQIRPGIPIILYTGHSDVVDEQRAQAAGVRHFVMIPVAFEELGAVIRRALNEDSGSVSAPSHACPTIAATTQA